MDATNVLVRLEKASFVLASKPGSASARADNVVRPMKHSTRLVRRMAPALASCVAALLLLAAGALGMANHEGWPQTTHHEGHPNNESGTMRGLDGHHNIQVHGNGDDRIWHADEGDAIWGDAQQNGKPISQPDFLHGAPIQDWLYA